MGSNWMMVMLVVSLFGPAPKAWAIEAASTGSMGLQGNACHAFLMAAECMRYQTTLATLPIGPERDRYLAEQRALIADREHACNSKRWTETVLLQPTRKVKRVY